MWPERGEALSRTIEAEAAIADLYGEALRRWAPAARDAVLPAALTAASLPPDPAAIGQTQTAWEQHAEQVVLAGMLALWAVTYAEAADGLGMDLPELPNVPGIPDSSPAVDAAVLRIVAEHTGLEPEQVATAVERVPAVAGLSERADEFVAQQRPQAFAVTGAVQHKVQMAVRVAPDSPVVTEQVRAAAADVMAPDSAAMQDVAQAQGYQAAGVMNHAVLTAAEKQAAELDEELEAVWLATLDAATRDSHWRAWGERVPLGSMFTVGGEQLQFPGDTRAHPREWKNCRCRLGILAKDEPLPDEVDLHTERLDGRDSVVVRRDGRTQQEEIDRRRRAGNVRARDEVGRVASAAPTLEETTMADDTFLTFTDVLFAVVGTPTSDGRVLAADTEVRFRDCPMPLQWCEKNKGGHDDSVTIGVIESMSLNDAGEIRGSGYVLNNDHAVKAIDLVKHGVSNPSIDFVAEEVLAYEDGTPVTEENFDPERRLLRICRNVEVMAATLVSIPAFGQTRFALDETRQTRDRALVASAAATFAPPVYDPVLFSDPALSGPTRVTISEDGHVFGHIACWRDRHRSVGLGHITPPRSNRGYAHFHSSPAVHLSDGSMLPVGRLTVGIGHAPTEGVSNAAAQAHYDNASNCWALVRAGEDQHGIWVSGVVAPWASAEQVQMAMSAPLSGDWRPYGGDYELVAVLSVNTPGFLCAGSTRGEYALVASLGPSTLTAAGGIDHLSADEIKAIVASALEEHTQRAELAARREAALAGARAVVPAPSPVLSAVDRARLALTFDSPVVDEFAAFAESRMPAQLKKYWLSGPGAAKVGWGSPGSYRRCLKLINSEVVEDGQPPLSDRQIKGLCANLYKEATGRWPSKQKGD